MNSFIKKLKCAYPREKIPLLFKVSSKHLITLGASPFYHISIIIFVTPHLDIS